MVHLVRTCCERFAIPPDVAVRVELVLEELFTNTVQHGYRAEDGGKIWITIEPAAGGIRVIYQDAAPSYNPLAIDPDTLARAHAGSNPETRPASGLGLILALRLSSTSSYCRDDSRQRNVIRLEFAT